MAENSVISKFQFINYKIDRVSYEITHNVSLLHNFGTIDNENFELSFRIRVPNRIKKEKIFITGLDVKFLQNSKQAKCEDDFIFRGEMGIVGIFKVVDGELSEDVSEKLAKIQGPALLLPYLRAALTSMFTNNGIGSFIFPLINIYKMAEDTMSDVKIVDIEPVL